MNKRDWLALGVFVGASVWLVVTLATTPYAQEPSNARPYGVSQSGGNCVYLWREHLSVVPVGPGGC